MLDVSLPVETREEIASTLPEEVLYTSTNPDKFWIRGLVLDKTHVTLLYGLLQKAYTLKPQILEVLAGWETPSIEVEEVSFFDAPDKEEYYTIIAKIKKTPLLLEGHNRLQFLPHINTFPIYSPHITLAYIKKDELVRDRVISQLSEILDTTVFEIQRINLGRQD